MEMNLTAPLTLSVPWAGGSVWVIDFANIVLATDLVIFVSFAMIAAAMARVLIERRDVVFPWVALLLCLFLGLSALSHFITILTTWLYVHVQEAFAQVALALVSALAAVRTWQIVPALLTMPSHAEMSEKHAALSREIELREAAEAEVSTAYAALKRAHADLELHVERRTAELRRANEELERYAYVASHDMRAPLRALTTLPGWVRETMLERYGRVDPAVEIDLMEMEVQSNRMDALLTDLLTYARVGGAAGTIDRVDPVELIEDAVLTCALPEGFAVHVPRTMPRIRCHPTEFSLVMRNMIGNAVKHHDQTRGLITITAEPRAGKVVFRVGDDGPGIPERFAHNIFEMFTSLRPRDEVEGSGLGLAIVKKVVSGLGGAVRLVPAQGRGATFELSFPA